ncbi:MAG: TonB-dependent receptor [Acidobacteria bacterium]|nr:TonB-dependent receptor [Acidobacteriota bacterium]
MLVSLRKRVVPVLVLVPALASAQALARGAEEPQKLPQSPARAEVAVVATRLDVAAEDVTVRVLTHEEIQKLPARSLVEVLRTLPGLDVRRRGVDGVQADVGIRGADYNGTLFLVDGEPVNDPQTNHLSADLDVPLDAIERIEVLSGAGAALYGSDAVGGVVNVVTRGAALGRARYQLEGRFEHGTQSLDAGGLRVAARLFPSLAVAADAERAESSGFRDDTEFATRSLRASAQWESGIGPVRLAAGYAGRRYGAYAFYGTRYPDQQETTITRTVRAFAELTVGKVTLSPSLSVRAHHDDYVLVRENPAFYENLHDTNRSAFRLAGRTEVLGGRLAFGVEAGRDTITSTNLGERQRNHGALFAEWGRSFSWGSLRGGLRGDDYEGAGSRLSPHAALSVNAFPAVSLRASVGTAFRVPTFLDLYYNDPQNKGNPDLAPETAVNLEAGARLSQGPVSLDAAVFQRRGRNLIDYVRSSPADRYEARNVREATTTGLEAVASWNFEKARLGPLSQLALQGTVLHANLESLSAAAGGATEGKYVLDPLRWKWDLLASVDLPQRTALFGRVSYQRRTSQASGDWVVDARASWEVVEGHIFDTFLEVENLTDESLEERPGVPLPGRRVALGLHLRW